MATASSSTVSKTAYDALLSKHSAMTIAGYQPLPSASLVKANNLYCKLLSDMLALLKQRPRRQTPLVNAGYAMRVAVILQTIETFLEIQYEAADAKGEAVMKQGIDGDRDSPRADDRPEGIQILVLGAGLDVTGLWACLLHEQKRRSEQLRVVGVDQSSVCRAKRSALETIFRNGGLDADWSVTTSHKHDTKDRVVLSAESDSQSTKYCLVQGDLQDIRTLESLVDEHVIDPVQPILVVSELVLVYLNSPSDSCDKLLQWCANRFFSEQGHTRNCFVALEPLGPLPKASMEVGQCRSVLDGYKLAYCQQFSNKLQPGQPTGTSGNLLNESPSSDSGGSSFSPFGSSCADVESRMRRNGFHRIQASLLGSAIAGLDQKLRLTTGEPNTLWWKPRELFDEHAALTLHLRSYAVVCAFSQEVDTLIRQRIYPWMGTADRCHPKRIRLMNGTTIWITKISRQDEAVVRSIFRGAYEHLFASYPAIRKMVKTALKKDLAQSVPDGKEPSAVETYYAAQGGVFLVAIEVDLAGNVRTVRGAIGLRRLSANEIASRPDLDGDNCSAAFEVHRLVVGSSSRGVGVASALLRQAQEIVSKQIASLNEQKPVGYCLVATTPSVLEAANSFYESHGFHIDREVKLGDLQMRTYMRDLSESEL